MSDLVIKIKYLKINNKLILNLLLIIIKLIKINLFLIKI